jgi:hypothetical protein
MGKMRMPMLIAMSMLSIALALTLMDLALDGLPRKSI